MPRCDVCGNEYDKTLGADTLSTASSARSTCWRPPAITAGVGSSATASRTTPAACSVALIVPARSGCRKCAPDGRKVGASWPARRHLRGVGPKEQRQYEHIKEAAEKEGRYGKRAAEVAARTVLKRHTRQGHRKGQ